MGKSNSKHLRRGLSLDQMPATVLYDEKSFVDFVTDVFAQEVELNDSMQTLFRGNCAASRLMSHCFRTFGSKYLKQLLEPHIPTPAIETATPASTTTGATTTTTITSTAANNDTAATTTTDIATNISYEIDSTKLEEDGDIDLNQKNLLKLTKQILDSILSSANDFPPQLNLMCICLRNVLCKKYPNSDTYLKAVGTVIFLRFINPAIVAPYESGIVDKQPPPKITRGLMLVSKILQNIANNVEFSKEEHMLPFNDFVRTQFEPMRKWVIQISSERTQINI
uniref:Neurofibromin n=1 Tax=Aceria tosichella TaxID=561515 RepID=A0A6G1SII6_9ACAR